jgi:hypothetical protein
VVVSGYYSASLRDPRLNTVVSRQFREQAPNPLPCRFCGMWYAREVVERWVGFCGDDHRLRWWLVIIILPLVRLTTEHITVGRRKRPLLTVSPVDFVKGGTHVKSYNAGVGSAAVSTGCTGDYYFASFRDQQTEYRLSPLL